jgi:ketosteroid isomerase-like protein
MSRSHSVRDSDEIKALEDRRYRAMLAGDTAALDELCSDNLIYTHSKADHDDKASYLRKVSTRYFTYLEIAHPADRILVVDGAGQGFCSRHDRARRQSLSRSLGARTRRLEVCCLSANAHHQ